MSSSRIRDLPDKFHTFIHLKLYAFEMYLISKQAPQRLIKTVTFLHSYLWNWPWNRLRDLYWLPTTFMDWVAGKECYDCGAPLDIWGDCTGLRDFFKKD